MKRIIALITSVLFICTVASVSIAAEKKTEPVKKEAAPVEKKVAPKKKQVTGEVKAIDTAAKTITVSKKIKDKVAETVISADDKLIADVKVGDKVTIQYLDDGKNTAKSLKKAESKSAKKTEEKKTETKKEEKKAEPAKKPSGGY